MLAIICVTVVLPLLPVTAISGRLFFARQAPASCIRAWRVSFTCRPGCCNGCCETTATAPAACGLGQEAVRVETLALQGDEEVARLQGARVGVHAGKARGRVADQRARQAPCAQGFGGLAQGPVHRPALSMSAARACCASSKGWRMPAISW